MTSLFLSRSETNYLPFFQIENDFESLKKREESLRKNEVSRRETERVENMKRKEVGVPLLVGRWWVSHCW